MSDEHNQGVYMKGIQVLEHFNVVHHAKQIMCNANGIRPTEGAFKYIAQLEVDVPAVKLAVIKIISELPKGLKYHTINVEDAAEAVAWVLISAYINANGCQAVMHRKSTVLFGLTQEAYSHLLGLKEAVMQDEDIQFDAWMRGY